MMFKIQNFLAYASIEIKNRIHILTLLVTAVALCSFATFTHADAIQLDLSSVYNIDGVANIGDFTQSSLDQPNSGGNYVFLTQSLATNIAVATGDGLLDSGFYSGNAFHPDMQLGYGLNPDGNNVLQFAGDSLVNVALTTGFYEEIHVAAMSGGGNSSLALTLHYSDGDVSTGSKQIRDWFSDFSPNANEYYIHDVRDRIHPDQTGYVNANDPAIFGYRFQVDQTRLLLSFDFVASGTNTTEPRINIFGATAVGEPVPEPATVALLGIGLVGLAGAEVRRRRKKKAVDKG